MNKRLTIFASAHLIIASSFIYSQTPNNSTIKKRIITTSLYEYLAINHLNTININIGTEIYVKSKMTLYTNIGLIKSLGETKDETGSLVS